MHNLSSEFDIVGPTVADDIRRLITRYGSDVVKDAIKKQLARRRGRIPERDWQELTDILREDARQWLDGSDPFTARSNSAIAREFAAHRPGHSEEGTSRRIMRKLSDRRRYYTLVEAEWLTQTDYPWSQNLRAIKALMEIGIRRDLWEGLLHLNEQALADYRTKFGEAPATMTMQELHAEAVTPLRQEIRAGTGNILQIVLGNQLK